jgi:hypothetical protein
MNTKIFGDRPTEIQTLSVGIHDKVIFYVDTAGMSPNVVKNYLQKLQLAIQESNMFRENDVMVVPRYVEIVVEKQ